MYRSQKKPLVPVRLKISTAAMTSATIVSAPILSSAHASDRVLGIYAQPRSSQLSAQKRLNIRIRRTAQRVGIAFEADQAVAQHDELGFTFLFRCRRHDADGASRPGLRHVRGDVERVPQLMRHDDRADGFEIA